jgi:predicted nucleic acid-binding Zn ribbon protein
MPFTILKKVLENVMHQQDFKGDIEAYKLFSIWNEVVGEKLGAHTRPSRIAGKTLYIEVNDHLWLAQLKYMKRDILRKIDQGVKPGLFNDIKLFLRTQ